MSARPGEVDLHLPSAWSKDQFRSNLIPYSPIFAQNSSIGKDG
jgi:hypothetical protein